MLLMTDGVLFYVGLDSNHSEMAMFSDESL